MVTSGVPPLPTGGFGAEVVEVDVAGADVAADDAVGADGSGADVIGAGTFDGAGSIAASGARGGEGAPDAGWACSPPGVAAGVVSAVAPLAGAGCAAGAASAGRVVLGAVLGGRRLGVTGAVLGPPGTAPLTTAGAPLAAPTGSSRKGVCRIDDSVPE